MWQKRLKKPLNPLQQMWKTAQKNKCQMPGNSMAKCQFKDCLTNLENKCEHLQNLDKYWSELMKAQQESTANYLYNIKILGSNQDPTLEKREPIKEFVIEQRVLHMGLVGGLLKSDMFYLLSFILHIMLLPGDKQKDYMECLQDQKLLDGEIIDYMELISRQQNAGLTEEQLKDFGQILKHLRDRDSRKLKLNYYKAEDMFAKSLNAINPYELEYLNNILHKPNKLSWSQFMYLAHFVDILQAMEEDKRQQYLQYFHEHKILPFLKFETLLAFMFSKSKRLKPNKLPNLLKALFNLMDIGPCFPQPVVPSTIEPRPLTLHFDEGVIYKALKHLLKERLPNIVRVTDLRTYLRNLLLIHPAQIWENLYNLKSSNILTPESIKYIENFIVQGKLGKVNKSKKNLLLFLLNKLNTLPVNSAGTPPILTNLVIPSSKGPIVERVEVEAAKQVEVRADDDVQKKEDLETKKTNKESKEKSSKKAFKKPGKKAGKKKK